MTDVSESGVGPRDQECIPITLNVTPSSIVGGSGSLSGSVTINTLPSGGCSVKVGCNHTSLLGAPGGSWPFVLNFPSGGSMTAEFTLTTNAVTGSTSVTIGSCESDLSAADSANWQATQSITLMVTPP